MDLAQLKDQALQLNEQERAELTSKLIQSLQGASEQTIAHLWATQAQIRAVEIDKGAVELIDSSSVEQEALALIE